MLPKKPWSGRFSSDTDKKVEDFTSSVHFDQRLYAYDIQGSIAHARMLGRQGIITEEEALKIIEGLGEVQREIERGDFQILPTLEDIHMNVEYRLVEKIGPVGEKLHTARSRNDQVALDLRLFLKDGVTRTLRLLENLKDSLITLAEKNIETIMPGYTHLQRAQPVLFSHHVMAYVEMLRRDKDRLRQCLEHVNVMPLGSAALAGTSFPIDREFVARDLDFERLSDNSMDAVSDRDFALEFLFAGAMIMMHMSRLAEELVLWSTREFGFVDLPDAYATGSSIMPQKKNPDVAELIRGKTGRVYGNLVALLTVMKGLPLTYNRDLQEDKEPVFDTFDTITSSLSVLSGLVKELKVNKQRMEEATHQGYITATDVADYLVRKGLPFRRAHQIVGELVSYCIQNKKELQDLSLKEFKEFSNLFEQDIFTAIEVYSSINIRTTPGGTAKELVESAIEKAKIVQEK